MGKTAPRRARDDHRDVVFADVVGSITGVIEGARIGATAGPGGAMVVGMAGIILRGAHASALEYGYSRLKKLLFG